MALTIGIGVVGLLGIGWLIGTWMQGVPVDKVSDRWLDENLRDRRID